MSDKRPYHHYVGLILAFLFSELVYKIEAGLGAPPYPPEQMPRRNASGIRMAEWLSVVIRELNTDRDQRQHYMLTQEKGVLFKAFIYCCNPVRAAEAIKKGKRIVPYCLRYRDGLS